MNTNPLFLKMMQGAAAEADKSANAKGGEESGSEEETSAEATPRPTSSTTRPSGGKLGNVV